MKKPLQPFHPSASSLSACIPAKKRPEGQQALAATGWRIVVWKCHRSKLILIYLNYTSEFKNGVKIN